MKPGDKVKLSVEGRLVKVDNMAWWRGTVLAVHRSWITVDWGNDKIWTEKPIWLEIDEKHQNPL